MVSSVNLKLKVWVKVGDDGVVGGREGGGVERFNPLTQPLTSD